jgi:hypothetical protein
MLKCVKSHPENGCFSKVITVYREFQTPHPNPLPAIVATAPISWIRL